MLPPLASDFRQIAPPPHHACAARSASHGLTRARLSSSTHILADAIHHGIYPGKVNSYTLAAGSEIETLQSQSATGVALTGNEFNYIIIGGARGDTLVGCAGNDL